MSKRATRSQSSQNSQEDRPTKRVTAVKVGTVVPADDGVKRSIKHASLYVKNQDEAKDWLVKNLGFKAHTDAMFGPDARWLTLCLGEKSQSSTELVLEPESDMHPDEKSGKQVGAGCVLFILETPDVRADVAVLKKNGVDVGEVKEQSWGDDAIFTDLYGNTWDLHESKDKANRVTEKRLAYVTWLCDDVDATKAWFQEKLGFAVEADATPALNMRWCALRASKHDVESKGQERGIGLALKAATVAAAKAFLGMQSIILTTEDAAADHAKWSKKSGIKFDMDSVKLHAWGNWNSFKDLHGNFIGLSSPVPDADDKK